LSKANLQGADLRAEANLSGANLSGANLTGANLSRANLRGAVLMEANLQSANLSRADLARADLTGADLTGADLTGADLRGANLCKAELRASNLQGANLTGVDLTGLRSVGSPEGGLPAGEGDRLGGANLSQTKLTEAQRRYAWERRATFDTMTDADWLVCPHPESLLLFLGARLSRRKQVLLACGSFYLHRKKDDHEYPWELTAREVAERFVDGAATLEEVARARAPVERALAEDPYPTDLMHNTLPDTGGQALNLLRLACGEFNALTEMPEGGMPYVRPFPCYDSRREVDLVRDVFGNPFRPAPVVAPGWLCWNDGTVQKLARCIYEERAFDRLPILADALQEAGCDDESVLLHCRGPGPHVRGCWVIDLLLGWE
jgi:hypothetical protein